MLILFRLPALLSLAHPSRRPHSSVPHIIPFQHHPRQLPINLPLQRRRPNTACHCGKGNLNQEKLKPLHHRQVKLYPDLGVGKKWQTIAANLPNVTVSTILEKRATPADRTQGLDLADYLLDCTQSAILSTKTGNTFTDRFLLFCFSTIFTLEKKS
jgi:hypothetical protein